MDFSKIEIRLNGEIFKPEIASFNFNIEFKNREDMILAIKRTEIKLQYGVGNFPVSYSLPSDIEINNNLLKFLTTIKRSEWMS
jgi:hypothetical protein